MNIVRTSVFAHTAFAVETSSCGSSLLSLASSLERQLAAHGNLTGTGGGGSLPPSPCCSLAEMSEHAKYKVNRSSGIHRWLQHNLVARVRTFAKTFCMVLNDRVNYSIFVPSWLFMVLINLTVLSTAGFRHQRTQITPSETVLLSRAYCGVEFRSMKKCGHKF